MNQNVEHLSESIEDYLESILVLSRQLPYVRSVDIASYLGFSKPSVSHAIRVLQSDGLIQIDERKHLTLTAEGMKIAEATWQRHVFFQDMLEKIGVPKEIAEQDACRIEHIISEQTFQAIQEFYRTAQEHGDLQE